MKGTFPLTAGCLTPLPEDVAEEEFPHNTYDYEQQMLSLVEHGRTEELRQFFASRPQEDPAQLHRTVSDSRRI